MTLNTDGWPGAKLDALVFPAVAAMTAFPE